MKNVKVDGTKILQIVGIVLTLGGSIVGGIVSDRKNKETLAKLVEEKLGQK